MAGLLTPLRCCLLLAATAGAAGVGTTGASYSAGSGSAVRLDAARDWVAPDVVRATVAVTQGGAVTGPPGFVRPGVGFRLLAEAGDTNSAIASVVGDLSALGATGTAPLLADSLTAGGLAYGFTTAETTAAAGLVDGDTAVALTATDGAGNRRSVSVPVVVDGSRPSVALADPGAVLRGSVSLTATASDPGSGLAALRIQRARAGTSDWTDICSTGTCTFATTGIADGVYDLRAVADDRVGNSATAVVASRTVDNTAPSVTLADPGTVLTGPVTLDATASDAGSGVASVRIQRSVAGAGAWLDVCTVTAPPYRCTLSTSALADGAYDLRAIATDVAGNGPAASAVLAARRVDNSAPVVVLTDPGTLRAVVTLIATAADPSDVTSLRIQRSPAGTGTWTDVCTVAATSASCSWDTRSVADGSYDLRALATDRQGNGPAAATVAGRVVDNTAPLALDVQSTNAAGGTQGRPEAGDTISFSFSEPLTPGSVVPGWTGAAPTTVTVRFVNAGSSDLVQVFNAANTTQLALGSIDTRRNYVSATVTFSGSTIAGAGTTLTATLGTPSSAGAISTVTKQEVLLWTPGAGLTDLAGNPLATGATVTEGGASDRDF